MKNIHLIRTDKPSMLGVHDKVLDYAPLLGFDLFDKSKNFRHNPVHIYITSDEEIKEGEICIYGKSLFLIENILYNSGAFRHLSPKTKIKGRFLPNMKAGEFDSMTPLKKIILTTDQDLIKDGVQAIDDEFLEWFVKNPSCEEVEVQSWKIDKEWDKVHTQFNPIYPMKTKYKIIIPKEEPKQETLQEYLQICKDCGSEEVARCKWVNVNTEEIYSADSGTTLEWCFNCKSETNIIDKEDYETKIQ